MLFDQLAHFVEMLAALVEQAADALARGLHFLAEAIELRRHLREKLHDGARSRGAGEGACALRLGKRGISRIDEHRACHLAASAPPAAAALPIRDDPMSPMPPNYARIASTNVRLGVEAFARIHEAWPFPDPVAQNHLVIITFCSV